MSNSTFALIVGAFYLTAGVLGFYPAFVTAPEAGDPSPAVETHYGYLFGLFPMNLLHNIVHALIGGAGLLAWRNLFPPREYAQFIAAFYGLLTLLAVIPGGDTMMGSSPFFGMTFGCMPSRPLSGPIMGGSTRWAQGRRGRAEQKRCNIDGVL